MDEPPSQRITHADLVVVVEDAVAIAALRYFSRDGAFAAALHEAIGTPLPAPLRALESQRGGLMLAWRSPTETVCLTCETAGLATLARQVANSGDGCLVDLTGGLKAVRVSGPRIADLLCRLGGTASVPAPGEARRSRMADVPVLAFALRAGETWLLVDRALLPHVLGWIRVTLADLTPT